jgi:hypothetical protein
LTALAVVVNEISSLLLLSPMIGAAMLNCKPVERMVAVSTPAMTCLICAAVVAVI